MDDPTVAADDAAEEARMDNWTTAFSIAVVVVAAGLMGVFIALLAMSGRFVRLTRTARRSLRCPYLERDVTAEFVENARTGETVDVAWCTAFTPAVAVQCGKPCLTAAPPGAAGLRATRIVQVGG
jgi:hypothetical protein